MATDEVLATARQRRCFRRYLRSVQSQAELDFWQDVENFRSLPGTERTVDGCWIFHHYLGRIQVHSLTKVSLLSLLEPMCRSSHFSGEVMPSYVFDEAQADAKKALGIYVIDYMNSPHYCGGLRRDLSEFPLIEGQFCHDEQRAFAYGDTRRRFKSIQTIRASLARQCERNPDFDMNHISYK